MNYNVSGNLSMEVGGKMEGVTLEFPINMDIDMDVLDEKTHSDINVSMDFLDEEYEYSLEMYTDGETCYTYDDEYEVWQVSKMDDQPNGAFNLNADDFKDATFEKDKKSGTYTVTQSFSKFYEDKSVKSFFDDSFGEMTGFFEIDEDEMFDAFGETDIVYVFDKSCNLLSVSMDEFAFETKIEEEGTAGTVSVSMGFEFTFSDFDEIDEKDIKVPKSVKEEAVETDDALEFNTVEDIGSDFEADYEEESEETTDCDVKLITSDGTDIYGSYNGVSLIPGANSWADTFEVDGWEFDNEDAEYSFMSCVNSKYEDVDVYVYNKDGSDTTRDDIVNDGFYGYDINVSYADEKPNMTFNGLTWGASADDVQLAYGEPSYISSDKNGTYIEYEEGDTYLSFRCSKENGLEEASLRTY